MFSPSPHIRIPIASTGQPAADPDQYSAYLQTVQLLERLHRRLMDVIKDEFERLGQQDLTPVQALILYNLGAEEVSAGELRSRGIYQGSNVSYNLKKLVNMGYVHQEKCDLDRRSVRIRLTDDGMAIRDLLRSLFISHAEELRARGILDELPLITVNQQFRRIESFWADRIRYIY